MARLLIEGTQLDVSTTVGANSLCTADENHLTYNCVS